MVCLYVMISSVIGYHTTNITVPNYIKCPKFSDFESKSLLLPPEYIKHWKSERSQTGTFDRGKNKTNHADFVCAARNDSQSI